MGEIQLQQFIRGGGGGVQVAYNLSEEEWHEILKELVIERMKRKEVEENIQMECAWNQGIQVDLMKNWYI